MTFSKRTLVYVWGTLCALALMSVSFAAEGDKPADDSAAKKVIKVPEQPVDALANHPVVRDKLNGWVQRSVNSPILQPEILWHSARTTAQGVKGPVMDSLTRDPMVLKIAATLRAELAKEVEATLTQSLMQFGKLDNSHEVGRLFNEVLKGSLLPSNGRKDAIAMISGIGEPNAYTFQHDPNAPYAVFFNSLIEMTDTKVAGDKTRLDRLVPIIGHEIAHVRGFDIWISTLVTSIFYEAGRNLIPGPSPDPTTSGPQVPKNVIESPQYAGLRNLLQGRSQEELAARLERSLDDFVELFRNERAGKYGRVENFSQHSPAERRIRHNYRVLVREMGKRLYKGLGQDRFWNVAGSLANSVAYGEAAGAAGEAADPFAFKKDQGRLQRAQEASSDVMGLIATTRAFGGDHYRAVRAAIGADAVLAGGPSFTAEKALEQHDQMMSKMRTNQEMAAYYDGAASGANSHPDSIARVGQYQAFMESRPYRVWTNDYMTALEVYMVASKSLAAEATKEKTYVGDLYQQQEIAAGVDLLTGIVAEGESVLYPALVAEADAVAKAIVEGKPAERPLWEGLMTYMGELFKDPKMTRTSQIALIAAAKMGEPDRLLGRLHKTMQEQALKATEPKARDAYRVFDTFVIAFGAREVVPSPAEQFDRALDAIAGHGLFDLPRPGEFAPRQPMSVAELAKKLSTLAGKGELAAAPSEGGKKDCIIPLANAKPEEKK